MVELQTAFVEYNKELQKKQGELTGPIIKKMMASSAPRQKNGYEIILDKQAAPYVRADPRSDRAGHPALQQRRRATGDAGDDKAEKKTTRSSRLARSYAGGEGAGLA